MLKKSSLEDPNVPQSEDTDPRWLGTRSLYLENYLLGSWEGCGVRFGGESKGQQNLDPPLIWSLSRSLPWTSVLWSLFLSSVSHIHFQIREFSSNWAAQCCTESGSFQSWVMSSPLLKSLWMSSHLPMRPSWWDLAFCPTPSPTSPPALTPTGMSQPPGLCTCCSFY